MRISSLLPRARMAALAGLSAVLAISGTVLVTPVVSAESDHGVDIGLPAYVWHGDPYLEALKNPTLTPTPPAVVILNIENGDGNVSIVDADADALRARVAANGEHVKVIGYVHSTYGARPLANVKASIDSWLAVRNGAVHYDGIFVDEVPRDCGPTAGSMQYRDYYRAIREYVWDKIPQIEDLVVNNVGTAVSDCYLAAGHDTADTFVTFEGSAETYFQTPSPQTNWAGYAGGNIISNGQYAIGSQYPSWRFWHMVHTASSAQNQTVLNTVYDRWAGMATLTDDVMVNPYDAKPTYLNTSINHAATLGD